MIKNSSKPSDGYSNPPSSPPMTLRQQFYNLSNQYIHELAEKNTPTSSTMFAKQAKEAAGMAVEALCQEIAREARIAAFADTRYACSYDPDCKHCRANQKTLDYLGTPDELTQKPPQPPQADSHTDIGDTVSGNEADNLVVLPPDSVHPPKSPNPSPSKGLNKIRRTHE